MQDELITLTTAMLAKKAGFNENTAFYFRQYEDDEPLPGGLHINGLNTWNEDDVPGEIQYWARPTQALLQRWLLETHGLHVQLKSPCDDVKEWEYNVFVINKYSTRMQGYGRAHITTFEKALQRAFELVTSS